MKMRGAAAIGHNSRHFSQEEKKEAYASLMKRGGRMTKAQRVRKSRERMKGQGLRYLQVSVYDEHRDDLRMIADILKYPSHPLYHRVILQHRILRDKLHRNS